MKRRNLLQAACFGAVLGPLASHGQTNAPIRLLVGASAGGFTDTLGRALAVEMTKLLGRPVVVENRPGAGGNIAADAAAKALPDGNTLLLSYTSHAINASLYPSLPFDPIKDFTPLTCVATAPAVLVVSPSLRVNTLQEFIALAKSKTGKLNFAITGVGSSAHLAGEMFKMQAGIDMASIPYKGTAPALNDVIAGQVEMSIATVSNVQSLIASGKLKALGVTSAKRLARFPDVPAIAEVLPGYESSAWYGLFGPAKMPRDLVERLSGIARKSVRMPAVRERLEQDGASVVASSPAEFASFVESEIPRWARIVKSSGARSE
jgi:tripartite-type tricarboxylate transporter receptor subunit TctC